MVTGTVEEVAQYPDSITGQYLSGRRKIPLPQEYRLGNGLELTVQGVRENNLKNMDVPIPLGKLVVRYRGLRLRQEQPHLRGTV